MVKVIHFVPISVLIYMSGNEPGIKTFLNSSELFVLHSKNFGF